MDAKEFESNLSQFTGTEQWYSYTGNCLLTDGAKFVADTGGDNGAYWIMDIIASYQKELIQKYKDQAWFQVWVLKVNPDKSATIICDDGNENILIKQDIEYTDFKLNEFKLYAVYDGERTVILLPSEY